MTLARGYALTRHRLAVFGILMCTEICDSVGAGICDGAPSTCSSSIYFFLNSANLICRDTDISHIFRISLRLRDN